VRACSPPAAGRPGIAPTSGIGPNPFGGCTKFTGVWIYIYITLATKQRAENTVRWKQLVDKITKLCRLHHLRTYQRDFIVKTAFYLSQAMKSSNVHSKWTYTKIGTIQRRLAWPLRKDDTQIREAFQIFCHFSRSKCGFLAKALKKTTFFYKKTIFQKSGF
jgi:hypothetical protein